METFTQAKRRWKKQRRRALIEVAGKTRALKKEGYTSSGWGRGYGTNFRYWCRNGIGEYLEWSNPFKVSIFKLNRG